MMDLFKKLRYIFGLDYRSLALMRIGIACALLADLLLRARDLLAHYTDNGVLTRADLFSFRPNQWFIPIHIAGGSWQFEAFLFILAGAFALMLLAGYRTKLATIVSWLLLISLHDRNPFVLQGGDSILRVTLFWAMFLPWEKFASMDYILGRTSPIASNVYHDLAGFAYLLQTAAIYLMAGLLKTSPIWSTDSTAVYYALNLDQFARPLGVWLRAQANLLSPLTSAVWHTEFLAPILFFSPVANGVFRTFAVLALIVMLLGFNLAMQLGTFGIIAITALFGVLPAWFWDRFLPYFFPQKKKSATAAIYYDSDCSFCYRIVETLRRTLLLPDNIIVASAASNQGALTTMVEQNSWVVYDQSGKTFIRFRAFCLILKDSAWAWPLGNLLVLPGVSVIGGAIYKLVATSRKMTCDSLPPDRSSRRNTIFIGLHRFVIVLVLILIMWDNYALFPGNARLLPDKIKKVLLVIHMNQFWGMFAPAPPLNDGWYVVPGVLVNGQKVDLFTGGREISYEKPSTRIYPNQRWQKYMMKMQGYKALEFLRAPYGRYLCREWNKTHDGGEALKELEIIFMQELTPPPGQQIQEAKPIVLRKHYCAEALP